VNRNGLLAASLVVAAGASAVLVAQQAVTASPRATPEQACLAAAELQEALGQSSVTDQAVLRVRAARLADLLAGQSGDQEPAGAVAVAAAIVGVLDDPRATVADLESAIAPMARSCRA
jgi:hypothetical protein